MTLLRNKLKPITLLNRANPLMRGLVCATALNEPGGVSRNLLRHGLLIGTPAAGGLATDITSGHEPWYNDFDSGYTFCLWHDGITLGTWEAIISLSDSTIAWVRYSSSTYFKNYHNGTGATMSNFLLSEVANPGMLICWWNGSEMRAYVDGVQVGSVAMAIDPKTDSTTSTLTIGGSCTVYQFLAYNRALSVSEMQRLYREPSVLFAETDCWPPVVVAGGAAHDLGGSIGAAAQLSATARATKCISGSAGGTASTTSTLRNTRAISGTCVAQVDCVASLSRAGTVMLATTLAVVSSTSGTLTVTPSAPETVSSSRLDWLGDALFYGATARAFKLGTVLTGGWFWTRESGCTAVYRGPSVTQVDVDDILCVTGHGAKEIVLPTHLAHEPNASYCYVVRRFNASGHSECTYAAAVMVRLGADGHLAELAPNAVLHLKLESVADRKIQLAWSYCSLDQQAEPEVFRIYTDHATGQIDWESPIATVTYEGRKFYRYQTGTLPHGLHQFAVVAQRAEQIEHTLFSRAEHLVQSCDCEGATVLAAEAIPQ